MEQEPGMLFDLEDEIALAFSGFFTQAWILSAICYLVFRYSSSENNGKIPVMAPLW